MRSLKSRMKHLCQAIRDELGLMGFQWKPFLIVTVSLAAMILSGALFPFRFNPFLLQVAIPGLLIILMREEPQDFGLGLGKIRLGIKITIIVLMLFIPGWYLVLTNQAFFKYYSNLFTRLLQHKSVGIIFANCLFGVLCTEFLFRGFLLFGLKKYYGNFAAISVSIIPYVLLHAGKPGIELILCFFWGLAWSYLALKTNSIWYGVFLHWLITPISYFWVMFYS